jgi:two-component system, chemotaxis family, chemotaxis protein CheY
MAKTILAVDDSRIMLDLIALTLAEFDVITAGNGREALAWLAEGAAPDLILSDLNMPVMGGMELIQRVRAGELHRHVPILMLTTESDPAVEARGRTLGASGWMLKPFRPQELVEAVRAMCP